MRASPLKHLNEKKRQTPSTLKTLQATDSGTRFQRHDLPWFKMRLMNVNKLLQVLKVSCSFMVPFSHRSREVGGSFRTVKNEPTPLYLFIAKSTQHHAFHRCTDFSGLALFLGAGWPSLGPADVPPLPPGIRLRWHRDPRRGEADRLCPAQC